jgi:hypothetical protein
MICPKCKFEQPDGLKACKKCGIIFEKYLVHQKMLAERTETPKPPGPRPAEVENPEEKRSFIKEVFLYVEPDTNPLYFAGRTLLFLALLVFGIKFILAPMASNYAGRSFLHLINLPFHEAGHILFRPFGQFTMMLGGSLMQLLIPLVCLLTFVLKTRDNFAASVTLWWFGESLMDLAPYINDARSLRMMLLGGVTGRDVADYHDWEFILRKLGMLRYDHFLAQTANTIGILLMLSAFAWGGFVLYRQLKNILSDMKEAT